MTDRAIWTEGLTRDFATVRAVDGLSLSLPGGLIFGLLGHNGAGKTTMIHLLLGLLEPTAGRAEVLGFDPAARGDEVRARTGTLLEHNGLYERLSAEENLDFFGKIYRLPERERRDRARELLTRIGLWERRAEPIGKWSRGMKQKLAVARTLLHRPPLIFLDEPTAGLDPVAAVALHEDLLTLVAREGVTVFLTTHNLNEAEKLCRLIGVIRQGRLRAFGSPEEIRALGGPPRVELRGSGFNESVVKKLSARPDVTAIERPGGASAVENSSDAYERLTITLRDSESPVAPLIRLLVESGAEIEEARKSRRTLEEVFLELMEAPGEKD